ncbi:MAG: serine/threonine-protein kinase, partial [Cyanobacteria bacterium J06560_2]
MKRLDKTHLMLGQTIGPVPHDETQGITTVRTSNRYQLNQLLGRQTGRRTFRGIDLQTQQPIVAKLLLFGPDFTWEELKLFEREAETLRALDHPSIPKYLDSFEVETPLGSGFVLIQTYIEARSLQTWITSGYRFTEKELHALARSLLTILKYLHGRHPTVIHRDIKPSNILLSEANQKNVRNVYLVDFGSVQTVKNSGTMTVVGTYGYMPPEQFGGRAVPASDLYSLGATLIYLSTGQHPAELAQDNFQIEFESRTSLSKHFAQWIQHLTCAELASRTASATQAIQQLSNNHQASSSDRSLSPPKNAQQSQTALASRSVCGDMEIFASALSLELQFSSLRLKPQDAAEGCIVRAFRALGWFIAISFAVSVGLGAIAFLAFLFWILFGGVKKGGRGSSRYHTQVMHLSLDIHSKRHCSMSLESSARGHGERLSQISALPLDDIVSAEHAGHIDFFYRENLGRQCISIYGSHKDIRWLRSTVNQWEREAG